jgi:hypothetical protein
MHQYLVKDAALKKAQPVRTIQGATPPDAAVLPIDETNTEDISAVRPAGNNRSANNGNNRNGNNQGNNRNGNNYRNGNNARNGNGQAPRNSQNGQRNGYAGQNNGRNGNNGNYMNNDPRQNNGNNRISARAYQFSQNGKPICHHCGYTGHMQKECRSRINANKPCVKPDGTTYFPVNSANDQESIHSVFLH